MGTRHFFWLAPDGGLDRSQDQRLAPTSLLASIGKQAQVNTDGSISSSGFSLIELEEPILGSAVIVDLDGHELNESDTRRLINEAMFSVIRKSGGQKPIHPSELAKAVDRRAAEFFRLTYEKYILVASLSIRSFPRKPIVVQGCRINTIKNPMRFRYSANLEIELQDRCASGSKHQLYMPISIHCEGRSVFDAADRALEALYLLLGLWNLFATYGSRSIYFSGTKQRPLGLIHSGPIYTLHNRDGSPACEHYWYEPNIVDGFDLYEPRGGWDNIEAKRSDAIRRLKALNYGIGLSNLLIKFAHAMGERDGDVAFLRMWSILETVTGTVGARYDETINRATWGLMDRDEAKEMLGYLRCRRNRLVHRSQSSGDRRAVAQLAKSFVEPHLKRLLYNKIGVNKLEEYGEWLRMPTSRAELEKKAKQFRRATRLFPKDDATIARNV